MSSSLICCNCDFNDADNHNNGHGYARVDFFECKQCPREQNKFCAECSQLHLRIKAFKHHCVEKIKKEELLINCANCELNPATLRCLECPLDEAPLCSACALLHRQIKAFRSHEIAPIDRSIVKDIKSHSGRPKVLGYLAEFVASFKEMIATIVAKAMESTEFQPHFASIIVGVFVIMLGLRLAFGRNAAIGFVIVCLVIWKIASDQTKVEIKGKVSFSVPDLVAPAPKSSRSSAAYSNSRVQEQPKSSSSRPSDVRQSISARLAASKLKQSSTMNDISFGGEIFEPDSVSSNNTSSISRNFSQRRNAGQDSFGNHDGNEEFDFSQEFWHSASNVANSNSGRPAFRPRNRAYKR